jgi:hypothetical protein
MPLFLDPTGLYVLICSALRSRRLDPTGLY